MSKSDDSDVTLMRLKPGPKRSGEKSMTASERKRKSRQLLATEGSVEFSMKLSGGRLEFVTTCAAALGVSRGQYIESLIEESLTRDFLVLKRMEQMQEAGVCNDDISRAVLDMISIAGVDGPPTEELVSKFKAALER